MKINIRSHYSILLTNVPERLYETYVVKKSITGVILRISFTPVVKKYQRIDTNEELARVLESYGLIVEIKSARVIANLPKKEDLINFVGGLSTDNQYFTFKKGDFKGRIVPHHLEEHIASPPRRVVKIEGQEDKVFYTLIKAFGYVQNRYRERKSS